jgi:hypothetical protein
MATSTEEIHGNKCTHDLHVGSSEAAYRYQLCTNNASGMHDPPLPVAALNFRIDDSLLQTLRQCVYELFTIMM